MIKTIALSFILVVLLTNCEYMNPRGDQQPPLVRPMLTIEDHPLDAQGVCLRSEDLSELMIYIHRLEHRCN
jgi:hypothetical protein